MTLETRKCACGCGTKFKALPTSKQRFCSKLCGDDHRPGYKPYGAKPLSEYKKKKPTHQDQALKGLST